MTLDHYLDNAETYLGRYRAQLEQARRQTRLSRQDQQRLIAELGRLIRDCPRVGRRLHRVRGHAESLWRAGA